MTAMMDFILMRVAQNVFQQEQSAQDLLTELCALSDVVKAIGGSQGVGPDGKSFALIKEMLQNQHGAPPLGSLEGMERHWSARMK